MTEQEILRELEARCDKSGSIRKYAATTDMSATFITNVLAGKQKLTPNLLDMLGYEFETKIVKKAE